MTGAGDVLRFRRRDGQPVKAHVEESMPDPDAGVLPPGVSSEILQLKTADGATPVQRLTVTDLNPTTRGEAFDRLDAEVLAGLRLWRWHRTGVPSGGALSRLIGREAAGETPFVLLGPRRGTPVSRVAGKLLQDEQRQFQAALLSAYRWISAAGIAHRGISPATVWWDGAAVQIENFLWSAPVGTMQPTARPGTATGRGPADRWVTVRDDTAAFARVLFLALTGIEPSDRQLQARTDLGERLRGVFGSADQVPPAEELLRRFDVPDPVAGRPAPDAELEPLRAKFRAERYRKHPELAPAQPNPPAPPQPPRRKGLLRRGADRTEGQARS